MDDRKDLNTWKIIIRYDGARYKGWQRLGGEEKDSTIQGKVEAVISSLCGEDTLVTGSGRTDAGVHALAQTAHFRTAAGLDADGILAHSARYLPDDIAVVDAEPADPRFHARYKVVEKHYLYRIDTGIWPDPFERKYAWHIPESLDWDAMRRVAGLLTGEHDFTAFTTMKSRKKSAVRTIGDIEIVEPAGDDPMALIRLKADGFLHNMVRIIVGTLVETGRGERTVESVKSLLAGGARADAGLRAPAKGLFLEQALY